MDLLLRVVLLSFCLSLTEALLCYQCADSSDNDGKNDCQTYVRTMNRHREMYAETSVLSIDKYVKNCTGYKGLNDLNVFCMIVEVKTAFEDKVRSYIRGCTDGADFLDVAASVEIDEKINIQNRTQCVNINGGLEACITICGIEYGDFCNGYVSRTARPGPSLFVLIIVLVLPCVWWNFSLSN